MTRLLVINYTMNPKHPALGHCLQWVRELAAHVEHVTVASASTDYTVDLPNVETVDLGWIPGRTVSNVVRASWRLSRCIAVGRFDAAFTHMANVQGLLAAPMLWALRIRHVVWYAHTTRPQSLRILRRLVSEVVTATTGSCPSLRPPALAIGHAVHVQRQALVAPRVGDPVHFVHAGRLDPVKRLEEMVSVIAGARRRTGRDLRLTLIGTPSSEANREELDKLRDTWRDAGYNRWLSVSGALTQHDLHKELQKCSAFLHACQSGLDKAPLEAALLGLPVVSSNSEVNRELGSWVDLPELAEQVTAFLEADATRVQSVIFAQRAAVLERHSLASLHERLLPVLVPRASN